MRKSRALALSVVAAFGLAACSRPAGPATSAHSSAPATPGTTSPSGAGVVAEVNGVPIPATELEQKVASRLARVRQEEYELRRQALDELIVERLVAAEAAKRHVSLEALQAQEVDAKARAVAASDVEAIYEQNKARFGGQPRDEALAHIREVMSQRAKGERRAAWEKALRDAARVEIRLEVPRAVVEIPAGAPSTGPAGAPVTLVEFTDYQCPYCHRAQRVIDEILATYSGKVRLVHLDFPLDGHPGAVPAARASRCAAEQGRFWEYHRNLMTAPGSLDASDLASRANAVGLDGVSFGACLTSGRHDAAIQASLRQGEQLGVTGTPAYFVNGRMLSGARPLASFAELIDAELAGR
ncbi:MAG TPA: thioredoxin domain-containing protein [Vicinamibacteria bacterium]|nr:thioredoxin domain-containing protein [Vicinamibacteria bacterium]